MKLCLLLLLYVTTGFTQPTEEPIKYDGYRLYQVTPKDQKELEILKHLKDNEEDDYKFWNGLLEGRTIDVLVPPSKIAKFEEQTVKGGMNFSLVMDDVQKFIDEENPLASSRKSFGWDAYYRLDQVCFLLLVYYVLSKKIIFCFFNYFNNYRFTVGWTRSR